MMEKNHYRVLGVNPKDDTQEILKAYRRLVKECHPDVAGPIDAERFREIAEAYEILSDAERRRNYDRRLSAQNIKSGRWNPQTYENWAEPLRPCHTEGGFRDTAFFSEPFEDPWYSWFKGVKRTRPASEVSLSMELTLNSLEAKSGVRIPLTIPMSRVCPECDGAGRDLIFLCPMCRGTGHLESREPFFLNIPPGVRDGAVFEALLPDELGELVIHMKVVF